MYIIKKILFFILFQKKI